MPHLLEYLPANCIDGSIAKINCNNSVQAAGALKDTTDQKIRVLSLLLCYYSGVYCQYSKCWPSWFAKSRHYAQELNYYEEKIENDDSDLASSYQTFQVFVMCIALLILSLSLTWLLANSVFKKSEIRQSYSRFEMPTAVACSLFAGICAMTEFHHSIDYSFLHWSEKWTFAAIDATALSFLHAVIAFALQ